MLKQVAKITLNYSFTLKRVLTAYCKYSRRREREGGGGGGAGRQTDRQTDRQIDNGRERGSICMRRMHTLMSISGNNAHERTNRFNVR